MNGGSTIHWSMGKLQGAIFLKNTQSCYSGSPLTMKPPQEGWDFMNSSFIYAEILACLILCKMLWGVHESDDSVISRRHCFTIALPNLALAIFLSFHPQYSTSHKGGEYSTDVPFRVEHPTVTHSLHSDQLSLY